MSTRTKEGPFPGITRPHHACPSLSRPKIPCDKPAYKAIDPCGTRFISGDLGLPVTEAIANLSGEPEGLGAAAKQSIFTIPNIPYYDEEALILYQAIDSVYVGKEPSTILGEAQR